MVDVFSNCTGTVNEQRKTVQSPKLNPGNYLPHLHNLARLSIPVLEVTSYGKLVLTDGNVSVRLAKILTHHGRLPECDRYQEIVDIKLPGVIDIGSGVMRTCSA